ncbi:MAG TPA: DUF58 domain-containing protein [Thermoanaerobaculia bacterium]|nr:DUF58 domain-containing protein [Thermoanaerobaculia bacterium]
MRPGPLLPRLLVITAALAALIPVAIWVEWVVVGAFALVVFAAGTEAVALRRVKLLAERPARIALALDEVETTAVDLSSNAARPLKMIVRQRWPELVAQRAIVADALCRPGEVVRVDMSVRAIARGSAVVERVAVAMTFFGIVERIARAGAESELDVLPNTRAVRRLHKQLNAFALRGIGARAAPRIGKGREFDRLRDYVIDDDYRDIAWRASARHGRLIVREFRLDRSQEILLCLDQGHRMAARVAQITRLDHAVNATLLISYICNRMEDKVGLVAFDTDVDKGVPVARGPAHLRAITAYVTHLEAAYRFTDYLTLATNLRRRLHHRTLILMLTVLPEKEERFGLLRAVEMLAPQHLPLIVVLNDPNLKAAARFLPSDRAELSRTLVARELWMNRVELTKDLRARGALVVESTPEDAGVDAVNAYIDVKRRQLL